jgi:hypothetical protein
VSGASNRVLHQDATVCYPHFVGTQGFIGGRSEGLAGTRAEVRPVPRADDLTFRHFRALQRLAVMCTTVFYCVELTPTAYDEKGETVDIGRKRFLIFE